ASRPGAAPASRLRRDEVEPPDVSFVDEDSAPEAGGTEAVGIDVDEELAATLAGLGQRADLHDLPARTDRDVAVGAVVRAGHDLVRRERADLSQAVDLCAECAHGAADVDDDPHFALAGSDRRLVDEAEETLRLLASALVSLRDAADVRDHVEREPAVGGQGDRQRFLDIEEIGKEEVSVLVERKARVTARIAEVVVVADQLRRPRL